MSSSSTPRVAVLGAGITGITTAYRLARAGCAVSVFDRHPYPAMDTSFANGGQLSASNAEVWNAWSNVRKGLGWMLRSDAPLLVRGTPSWHKLSWFAAFLRAIARQLGDHVNVYPVKGYSITVDVAPEEEAAAPWHGLLDDKVKIVTSRLGPSRLRIAGTAEFDGMNRDIRMERIAPLVAWCRRRFPGLSTRSVVPWAGLRPMLPDMLPRVARGRRPNVFYNTGHGHLGWTLSAATADLVTQMVMAKAGH